MGMNTSFKAVLQLLTVSAMFGCSNTDTKKESSPPTKSMEIELSVPHGDYAKTLFVGSEDNPVSVIFRNNTDSVTRMYEDWNSWGYYNISFEITTKDSTYIVRKKQRGWWKNFPSYHRIDPGESLVFNFNLDESTEDSGNKKRIIGSSYQGWTGLPHKDYDSAKIKVLYELKEDFSLSVFDSSAIKNEAIKRSFLTKLSSKPYDVSIVASTPLFKEVINLDTSGTKKTPE
jgi:hypothetical protein